jgi:hypothetical protein
MNDVPVWINRKEVHRLFQIPFRQLTDFARLGMIRSVKFGRCQQSCRLYCSEDIHRVLTALAEGREPGRPPRKVRRAVVPNSASMTRG